MKKVDFKDKSQFVAIDSRFALSAKDINAMKAAANAAVDDLDCLIYLDKAAKCIKLNIPSSLVAKKKYNLLIELSKTLDFADGSTIEVSVENDYKRFTISNIGFRTFTVNNWSYISSSAVGLVVDLNDLDLSQYCYGRYWFEGKNTKHNSKKFPLVFGSYATGKQETPVCIILADEEIERVSESDIEAVSKEEAIEKFNVPLCSFSKPSRFKVILKYADYIVDATDQANIEFLEENKPNVHSKKLTILVTANVDCQFFSAERFAYVFFKKTDSIYVDSYELLQDDKLKLNLIQTFTDGTSAVVESENIVLSASNGASVSGLTIDISDNRSNDFFVKAEIASSCIEEDFPVFLSDGQEINSLKLILEKHKLNSMNPSLSYQVLYNNEDVTRNAAVTVSSKDIGPIASGSLFLLSAADNAADGTSLVSISYNSLVAIDFIAFSNETEDSIVARFLKDDEKINVLYENESCFLNATFDNEDVSHQIIVNVVPNNALVFNSQNSSLTAAALDVSEKTCFVTVSFNGVSTEKILKVKKRGTDIKDIELALPSGISCLQNGEEYKISAYAINFDGELKLLTSDFSINLVSGGADIFEDSQIDN